MSLEDFVEQVQTPVCGAACMCARAHTRVLSVRILCVQPPLGHFWVRGSEGAPHRFVTGRWDGMGHGPAPGPAAALLRCHRLAVWCRGSLSQFGAVPDPFKLELLVRCLVARSGLSISYALLCVRSASPRARPLPTPHPPPPPHPFMHYTTVSHPCVVHLLRWRWLAHLMGPAFSLVAVCRP
jgi:hypothetical protein